MLHITPRTLAQYPRCMLNLESGMSSVLLSLLWSYRVVFGSIFSVSTLPSLEVNTVYGLPRHVTTHEQNENDTDVRCYFCDPLVVGPKRLVMAHSSFYFLLFFSFFLFISLSETNFQLFSFRGARWIFTSLWSWNIKKEIWDASAHRKLPDPPGGTMVSVNCAGEAFCHLYIHRIRVTFCLRVAFTWTSGKDWHIRIKPHFVANGLSGLESQLCCFLCVWSRKVPLLPWASVFSYSKIGDHGNAVSYAKGWVWLTDGFLYANIFCQL